LEITIAGSCDVVNAKMVSSELADPESARQLVERLGTFRFEPDDFATVTVTKPIDFFPIQ
jgi:hypothetical protein